MASVTSNELFVVPTERHVERLAREGSRGETRASLRSRLVTALLPDVSVMDARECRLVLALALSGDALVSVSEAVKKASPRASASRASGRASGGGQLDLFGGSSSPAPSPPAPSADAAVAVSMAVAVTVAHEGPEDALLAAVRQRGGASWARFVAALDRAITLFRARNGRVEHLDRVAEGKGFVASRARTLATAVRTLDAHLERAGARDARLVGTLVADAIRSASAADVEKVIGTKRLRARWLLTWEPSDVAWWRALDDKLVPVGGGARVVLPTFDAPLEGTRERDPLDALAEELAQGLDAPTESETIAAVLGSLAGGAGGSAVADSTISDLAPSRVRLVSASDALAQARAVASEIAAAIARGASVERVAIAFPALDERTLAPLRRALEDEHVVWHESRGPSPADAPVVSAALLALDAATSLDRVAVARLLRSGWVDGARLTGDSSRDAQRSLSRLARVFETSPTASGKDAVERLVRTASATGRSGNEPDVGLVTKLVGVLAASRSARTRHDHVRATRALWAELGIGARAGRGGLATFGSDAAPVGVARAERLAIARDARAWEALVAALDLQETTAARIGVLDQVLDAESFRLELLDLLDAGASQPGAGRAAAVRVTSLADVAGDELDLLVVVDANEGLLPRDEVHDAFLSESLSEAIGKASRGTFVPPSAGAMRARELTALAVAAADAQAVVLVSPREDSAGAPLAPSSVVTTLERGGVPVRATELEPPLRSGADIRVRVARERERESFFLDPTRPLSDVVGDLAPTAAAARLLLEETGGGEKPFAVTGLERFGRCAFMGFAHVVLAARESELIDELPDAREEGTLIHEVLAAAFRATKDLWSRRPRPKTEIMAIGTAASDALLDQWQGHAALRTVVRLGVQDSVRAILSVAIDDEAWDFTLAEQTFGAKGATSWKPLVLAEDDLSLTLRGSIDRVDRAHDGHSARVVDYKRSKSTVTAAGSSLGETALQVPLYVCATNRELGVTASGSYVPTQARDVVDQKTSAKVAQRMEELVMRHPTSGLAEIEQRALAIVASARSGALAPIPARESECRFCAVSGGCRKPRFAMAPIDEIDEERDIARPPRDAP